MSTRVVLDPGSETEFVLRRPAIARIAQSLPWVSPDRNPEVLEVIEESIAGEKLALGFEAKTADPFSVLKGPELEIWITLEAGLEPLVVRDLIERISSFWSKSEEFATSVDSVSIKLRS